jgi:putative flippase GtrA
VSELADRTARALRRPHNWIQLAKFGIVGASGYVINLAVYTAILGIGAHKAALVSFVVSATALVVNQLWLLVFLDWFGWGKIVSQAIAIVLVTPLNFLGNKLWSFRV